MNVEWPTALVAVAFLVVATVVAVVGPEEHRGVAVQAILSTGLVLAAAMNRMFPKKEKSE